MGTGVPPDDLRPFMDDTSRSQEVLQGGGDVLP